MKKFEFILKNLDCAACANEIQEELNKHNEIKNPNVNFGTLKLTYETDLLSKEEVELIVKSVEPDVELVESVSNKNKGESSLPEIIRLIIGVAISAVGMYVPMNMYLSTGIIIVGFSILLYRTIKNAIKLLVSSHKINENFLITISVIGAFLVGEHFEGLMVITLYEIGKILESKAVNKTRKSISELMDIKPEYANLKVENDFKQVSPEDVRIGDIIAIKHGEKIPLDGRVIKGNASLDTSSLTGESKLTKVQEGDKVLSGSINNDGFIEVEVIQNYKNSTVSKILELVENATEKKAKAETFVNKASKIYTPIVLALAIIVAAILPIINKNISYSESIYRALIFLVISCPCAIAISVPLGYFSGIGRSSKGGILIKGSDYIDALKNVKEIVFDKTGTLTKGKFEVNKISSYSEDYSEQDILKYAAYGESNSNHPIAKSIMKMVDFKIEKDKIKDFKEIPGKGLSYDFGEDKLLIGSSDLVGLDEKNNDITKIYVKKNNELIGEILLSDSIKHGTKEAISKIKNKGIGVKIFTGDNKNVAKRVASELDVKEVFSEMLPTDKYGEMEKIINENKNTGNKVAFVGDGINDSPVLALADVGISMGGIGSHAAIEASDVVIMTDSIEKINEAIDISKKTSRIIKQNLAFAIFTKILILVLSTLGLTGMSMAVFADVGVTLITILNTLRILK